MTLNDLIAQVEAGINQDLSGDTKRIKRSTVIRWINDAYEKMHDALTEYADDFNVERSETDLVASQAYYELPQDFKRLIRVEIAYTGTEYVSSIETRHRAEYDVSESASFMYPKHYLLRDNLRITPEPSSANTDGLRIEYIPVPILYDPDEADNALLGATDEPDQIPDSYHQYLADYATYKALLALRVDQYSIYRGEFENGLSLLEETGSNRDNSSSDYVTISNYVD